MNIRPRCREWLPLSTQQLRLRNLQAIQALNVEITSQDEYLSCSSPSCLSCQSTEILLYYTLHSHPENEAFYQSEKLPWRMHLPLKWAEIQCLSIVKSNVNCVCIKLWMWTKKSENENKKTLVAREKKKNLNKNQLTNAETNEIKEPISALTNEILKSQRNVMVQDKLLFTWGVYFSGLIPLSQNNEVKCFSNSLIFQMNDEFFASPEYFTTENLRDQLALNYERYSASVPKCSIPTPDELTINSPHVSRSSSPTVIDWQKDLLRMSKTRYTQLNCVGPEVRRSYTLIKLLLLQQLQRRRLQTQRECVELTEEIKRLSIRCITKEQLPRKPRTTSNNSNSSSSLLSMSAPSHYHSMGRTLSLLLAEQQRIEPQELLHAQYLQEQVESLKSKQRLLQSVQSSFSKRITSLRQQLNAATLARQQLHALLKTRQCKLKVEEIEFETSSLQLVERSNRKQTISQQVERRMYALCLELKEIYPITELPAVCEVVFPSYLFLEGYEAIITPMALSASLGYIAHLVEMISVVTNRPLRNPIIHQGSQSRIMDTIKDMPSYTSREFPLYSRSRIHTKAVKYAVNLLNQNVAQLCYAFTGCPCNHRETLQNIMFMFEGIETLASKHNVSIMIDNILNHRTKLKCNTIKNGKPYASLSESHSSVDMNHMQPPTLHPHTQPRYRNMVEFPLTSDNLRLSNQIGAQPIGIPQESNEMSSNQQRICRSVGSYTDSEDESLFSVVKAGYSNSDSNLTLQSGHI